MAEEKLKYPVGMQSFPEIRERGFVYVDKSQYIPLLMDHGKYFFLRRPRRFGKSLFLSMLEAYFQGRRELFEGLAASRSDHDWTPAPVLHLDFTGINYTEADSLKNTLNSLLSQWEDIYGIKDISSTNGVRFQNIISAAHRRYGRKVVILVDEYDKPLIDTIDQPELQENFRNQLRGIYGNLKRMDQYIQFALLTGITRFGKLNIFSDINNLNDISMMPEFSGICGITSEELHEYFHPGVVNFAQERGCTAEQMYDELRDNYDGYHFSPRNCPDIYNPFSLLKSLQDMEIGEYWYGTGTPLFLVKRIKSQGMNLRSLNECKILRRQIENVSFDLKGNPIPILYQSGYLTIKGYDPMTTLVTLGFPNREVEHGFIEQLMEVYVSESSLGTTFGIANFLEDVESGNAESFMRRLQSLMASIAYDSFTLIGVEQHYQDVVYLLFKLLGYYCHTEYRTATGRIDMVVETNRFVYVFEFKLNKTAPEALDQIDSKEYMLPFQARGRKLIKIGANFSTEKRNLNEWLIEAANQ